MTTITRVISNAGAALTRPDGSPLAFVQVTFLLTSMTGAPCDVFDAITGDRVVGSVLVVTDANGLFSAAIWPNDRGSIASQYVCTINYPGAASFSAGVPSGSTPLTWLQFKTSGLPVTPQIVTALTAYIGQMDADVVTTGDNAATATAQAAIATAKAVLTAADAALTHADVLLTHADVAETGADVMTVSGMTGTATSAAATATAASEATLAALAAFRSKYLGSFATDPTLDGNGNALAIGAEYFNSTSNKLRVYTVSGWADYDAAAQTEMTNAALSAVAAAGSASTANTYQQQAGMFAAAALNSQNASATSSTTASISAATALNAAGTAQTYSTALAAIASQTAIVPAATVTGFNGTVVASTIYDTRTDSDGGAWRKRCQNTSWYNEVTTATGKWLGYLTDFTAAISAGGINGDYYYARNSAKFMTITSSTTQVENFRGSRASFPEVVAITAEAGRVIIWDLTDSSVPMWMVFNSVLGQYDCWHYSTQAASVTSVCASQGILVIGRSGNGGGYTLSSFINDNIKVTRIANDYGVGNTNNPIGSRNSVTGNSAPLTVCLGVVNSIAATVLPNSPIDPATGLPVPTIAVGTAGGVSVIKDDGTVVNSSHTGSITSLSIAGTLLWTNQVGGVSTMAAFKELAGIAASWAFTFVTTPGSLIPSATSTNGYGGTRSYGSNAVSGSNAGIILIKNNPTTPAEGMVAYITNTYNSGWMNGDSRGAWLADTVAETVSGAELVTNGTFNTDVSGWTDGSGASSSISWNPLGYLQLNVGGASNAVARQNIATVIGKTYRLTADIVTNSGTNVVYGVTDSALNQLSPFVYCAGTAKGVLTFKAATTTTIINIMHDSGASTSTFDNISVTECAADRSVKANPLTVVGTLTKVPVATGSQLVAYSGFSASNYLTQPYSSQLDFGTGDFCVMGWVNTAAGGSSFIFNRTDAGITGPTVILMILAGTAYVFVSLTGFSAATTCNAPNSSVGSTWELWCGIRRAGMLYLYRNGVQVGAPAASTHNLTNITSSAQIGTRQGGQATGGSLALVRASATAPSADQIAYIYETERRLFEAGAQCCIQGTSTTVTALADDDQTNLLHVGTSWGVTEFQGLKVVKAYAQTGVTAISAKSGYELISGTAGSSFYKPSRLLAEELTRTFEQRKAFGSTLVPFEFDAIAAQTAFVAPLGYSVKFVYAASALKRLGTGKDYTISNDGFRDTVNFAVAPGAAVWVSILCVRTA